MRYSQPFGTPEPPLGTYPRFVNGNPVTGTEGSIPPATSIDEDQIEIVTVIANVGLTPTHSDLTQLWQALQILIAKRYITTAITKTVHGAGADFPDLHAALNWLEDYTITQTGYVTFMVAPGKWTYTSQVEITHRNSNRIAIQGSALLGAAPVPGNISVTGYHSATDGTNQIIYLRSVFATELSFTGGVNGIKVTTGVGGGAVLRYLLITGSQTALPGTPNEPWNGCGVVLYGDVNIDCVAIWGFGNVGLVIEGASLWSRSSLSLTICYCVGYGIHSAYGYMVIYYSDCIVCSNGGAGISTVTTYSGAKWNIRGNNGPGLSLNSGAEMTAAAGSVISLNNGQGAYIVGSYLSFVNSTITNNSGTGVTIDGGLFWGSQSYLAGNGSFSINLLGPGSSATAVGAVLGATNPPPNTANANNWITA